MRKTLIEQQPYKDVDFTQAPLAIGEYEDCSFVNCIFTNADLSDIVFVDCSFEQCDLSNAKLNGTAFKTVKFSKCKLLGLHFDDCNPFLFALSFDACALDFSIFFKLKLKAMKFKDCQLEEVDFTEADLSNAVFQNCELRGAVFENTNLEGADFRTANGFSIDPELNRVRKARFSATNVVGLLDKYKISIEA